MRLWGYTNFITWLCLIPCLLKAGMVSLGNFRVMKPIFTAQYKTFLVMLSFAPLLPEMSIQLSSLSRRHIAQVLTSFLHAVQRFRAAYCLGYLRGHWIG